MPVPVSALPGVVPFPPPPPPVTRATGMIVTPSRSYGSPNTWWMSTVSFAFRNRSSICISRSFQLGEQCFLVDLAHPGARQRLGAHLDAARQLVVRQPVGEEGAYGLDSECLGAGTQAHHRAHVLA